MPKTNRIQYLEKMGKDPKESYGLDDLSKMSGIPEKYLKEVYDRGVGAWESNPRSVRIKGSFKKNPDMRKYPRSKRLSPEQWGYGRVYSFLNKGKTYRTADKDIADKIEKRGGGDIETKEDLEDSKAYALSNFDINELFDNLKIERPKITIYPDIENMRHADELFNRQGKGIVLYLVKGDTSGHWISLLKKGNTVEFNDSYGYKADSQDKKLGGKLEDNKRWKQDQDLLTNLIKESGYKIKSNPQQNQKDDRSVNTCGRHSIMRLLFSDKSTEEYNKMLREIKKKHNIDPDTLITIFTNDILGK